MVTGHPTESSDELAVPAGDLGPLAWVLDETRQSIQAATKALRRFAHEAEHARGVDLASVDASQLRGARQQLHQVAGALDMVGQTVAAQMVRGMEAAAQRFTAHPEACSEAAAITLEKSGFALLEFVESQLSEHPRDALGLFPQFRQVQELAEADRIHPADLWTGAWRWLDPRVPPADEALTYSASARQRLDQGVLKIMRHADPRAAADLAVVSRGLASGVDAGRPAIFWQLCAGFFEALATAAVPIDVYVKRAASRVLLQYTALARGQSVVSDRLAQDLLFFCAQARPGADASVPALASVRAAWDLNGHEPVAYDEPAFGLYDPAVLAQARRRVEAVKENWSALASGDLARLKASVDQLGLVVDSLERLHAGNQPLAEALDKVAQQIRRSGREPSAEQAMEVATAVLFLEASFAEFRPQDATFSLRMHELAQRLNAATEGRGVPSLQPWMEELYRRVSERQTLGTVVGELRITLADVEQRLDQFFRHPADRALLDPLPGLLAQMRGVLSVLGLDQAALAVSRMRERVEAMRDEELPVEAQIPPEAFEKLGNSLGAMGFLIDTLGYQPVLARKLFVYDEADGEFRFVGGRAGTGFAQAAPGAMDSEPAAQTTAPQLHEETSAPTHSPIQLEQVAALAALDERPALAKAAHRAAEAIRQNDPVSLDAALQQMDRADAVAGHPVVSEPTAAFEDGDDDLLDIFLDEAREVVANGRAALDALALDPADGGPLTTLRRAFHTLKGSSRMVGLGEFGAAAWALEQLLNAWLAEHRPADEALCGVATEALNAFSGWTEAIAAHQSDGWTSAPFVAMADALRLRGERVGLQATPSPAPASDEALAEPTFAEPSSMPAGASADAETNLLQAFDLPDLELSEPIVLESPSEEPAPVDDWLLSDATDLSEAQFDADVLAVEDAIGSIRAQDVLVEHGKPLEFEFQLSDAAEPDDAQPMVPVAVSTEPVALDDEGPAHEQLPPPEIEPASPAGAPEPDDVQEPVPAPAIEPAVTMVGSLRISTPLYNVYLSEADQWSGQLVSDLAEWSRHVETPIPERAVAGAHSLAGSSATVGFAALSTLARAVEHALERLQGQAQGSAVQAQVLERAAEEVRSLLHQFAAGMLKEPDVDLVVAVQALEPCEAATVSGSKPPDHADDQPWEPVASSWMALSPGPVARELTRVGSTATRVADDLDDEIDVADAIDPDLFEIFEEEAEELLPQLSALLRQWVEQPQHHDARAQALRVLHTLKGSARLAGALRLGEMAHRTESAIEVIGTENLMPAEVEPLLDHLDRIQADFQQLRVTAAGPAPIPAVADLVPAPPVQPELAASSEDVAETIDAVRGDIAEPTAFSFAAARVSARQTVRVRSQLLDRLMAQAGEVMTSRVRLDSDVAQLRTALTELTGNVERLRAQLRDVELQAEMQMQSRLAQSRDAQQSFDPLEFDRFTRMQELTRMMAESVNDVATVQRNLQRSIEASEDELAAQSRQSRELQRDLLRTRMVEFDGVSERLYRVVRQASKESGKQVRLDLVGGSIEVDRGILERMTPAFEHLLRNGVVHGIESPEERRASGKEAAGVITVEVQQAGNEVSIEFRDDGRGLDRSRIRERAIERGLVTAQQELSDAEIGQLVFEPGFTTATEVTDLAGRGVGLDVVRMEVQALGGRIETGAHAGQGTSFRLVLPLTTAVTHVVMIRVGDFVLGVPASLVQRIHRSPSDELQRAYADGVMPADDEAVPFFWAGALLQQSARSSQPMGKTNPVVLFRSAAQRLALHVDEVLGNQDVVIKALGPQLSRLPGLVAITALASGVVTLIYNPVALATVYGPQVRAAQESAADALTAGASAPVSGQGVSPAHSDIPLVLVVDDSITVRRVTQRLLQREGYRVALAADGLQGLERLQQERPALVLSDIEMPRMDGFDFLRNIRADAALHDLPVVMITSRTAEKHQEHARQLGANHYLGKPYSEDVLLGLIRGYTRIATALPIG